MSWPSSNWSRRRNAITSAAAQLQTFGHNAQGHCLDPTAAVLAHAVAFDERVLSVSPLAPGVVVVTTWVGSNVLVSEARKDGLVVGRGTYAVSEDGQTLTATVAGTGGVGAEFEQVIVFDRG